MATVERDWSSGTFFLTRPSMSAYFSFSIGRTISALGLSTDFLNLFCWDCFNDCFVHCFFFFFLDWTSCQSVPFFSGVCLVFSTGGTDAAHFLFFTFLFPASGDEQCFRLALRNLRLSPIIPDSESASAPPSTVTVDSVIVCLEFEYSLLLEPIRLAIGEWVALPPTFLVAWRHYQYWPSFDLFMDVYFGLDKFSEFTSFSRWS